MRTPGRAVLMGGALVCALVLVHVLAHTRTQIAGTDRVPNNAYVSVLTQGQRLCQTTEVVPAGTAALRLTIGTYNQPRPPLGLQIQVAGRAGSQRTLVSERVPGGRRQGLVELAVPSIARSYGNATICLRDEGTKIALAGTTPPNSYGFSDFLDGAKQTSEIRIDYMLAGRPSWFSMIDKLTYRMTLGKGGYVRAIGWLAPLLLMLAVVAVVVRIIVRAERWS